MIPKYAKFVEGLSKGITLSNNKLRIRALLVIGALIISWVCYGFYQEKFDLYNSHIIDRLVVLQPNLMPAPSGPFEQVVYVDANLYFSRSSHARVIQNLSSMKVAAQSIDFILDNKVDDKEDRALIKATAEAGNVFWGLNFAFQPGPTTSIQVDLNPKIAKVMEKMEWPIKVKGNPKSFYTGYRAHASFPELSLASKGIGFINVTADSDGILRQVPLLIRYQDMLYPSLPLRVVCAYLGVTPDRVTVRPGASITLNGVTENHTDKLSKIVIPIDKHGNMLINDTPFKAQIKRYSYRQISQASNQPSEMETLKKELKGKIAIVSETVEMPYKIRSGGKDDRYPLAAVHAAVIQNILTRSFFKLLPNATTILIELGLLAILFIMSIRFTSLSLSLGALPVAGIYVFLGGFLFLTNNLIFTFTRTLFLFSCALILLLIGLGIEKALLFAETERARRLAERELEIGREIQSGFFPTTLPEAPGWDLKIHFQAARHVAGDFYDVFTIGPERKMCVVVADVCDKGVGAALFMALFRSFIRVLSGQAESENHINGNMDPKEILKKTIGAINNYISITHETAGMFATIFYCIIDPKTGECYYINGGHEPPVIIGEGKIKARLDPTGPAVGAYPNLDYKVANATLETEDTLLVFTDGVTDALNKAGQSFTKIRLEDMLRHPFTSTNDLIGRIKNQINDHITDADQFDDITIAALRRKG